MAKIMYCLCSIVNCEVGGKICLYGRFYSENISRY